MITVKQRINLKFLANRGKTSQNLLRRYCKFTKKKQCQKLMLLNDTNDSLKIQKNVRTIKDVAGE